MNEDRKKVKYLIPLLILLFNALYCFMNWDKPGSVILQVPVLLIVIILYFLSEFQIEDIIKSNFFNYNFIPGWRLYSADMVNARKSPSGSQVSIFALLTLVYILTGMALLSSKEILIAFGVIPQDWDVTKWKLDEIHWDSIWKIFSLNLGLYWIFTRIANVFSDLTIRLGYEMDQTKHLRTLTRYFGLTSEQVNNDNLTDEPAIVNKYWDKISSHLDNIYGHKIWSGQGICALIDKIRSEKEILGTAQWFLLESASNALEQHISEDKYTITVCYKNTEEYSRFLSKTMQYCTKNIIWIVDRKDFVRYIFPTMIREVLFSLAQSLKKDNESQISTADRNFEEVFNKLHNRKERGDNSCRLINGYCEFCDELDKTQCSEYLSKCKRPLIEENYCMHVLNFIKQWAIDLLNDQTEPLLLKLFDEGKLWNYCKERHTDTLGFPHIRTYYEHRVPKSRIIELPRHPDNDPQNKYNTPNIALDTIDRIIDRFYLMIKEVQGVTKSDAETLMRQENMNSKISFIVNYFLPDENTKSNIKELIFFHAWKLFEHISNNDSMHQLVGFAEVRHVAQQTIEAEITKLDEIEPTFDIGLFDNCILVNTRNWSLKGSEERRVIWTLIEKNPIQNSLAMFDPIIGLSEEKKDQVLKLENFTCQLKEVLKI